MERLLRLGGAGGMGLGQSATPTDAPVVDTAEQVTRTIFQILKTNLYKSFCSQPSMIHSARSICPVGSDHYSHLKFVL